ncbi:hypothetical protein [Parasaccharibacter apium]|uniref:hypothetical protein n=1 Tax=Parasaccharibacter apium TaxID=1510841 RepID=UPI0015E18C8E|nr:hypothetical protein [Parasaccharibacter apium]
MYSNPALPEKRGNFFQKNANLKKGQNFLQPDRGKLPILNNQEQEQEQEQIYALQ